MSAKNITLKDKQACVSNTNGDSVKRKTYEIN